MINHCPAAAEAPPNTNNIKLYSKQQQNHTVIIKANKQNEQMTTMTTTKPTPHTIYPPMNTSFQHRKTNSSRNSIQITNRCMNNAHRMSRQRHNQHDACFSKLQSSSITYNLSCLFIVLLGTLHFGRVSSNTVIGTVQTSPPSTVSSPPEHKIYPEVSVPVGSSVQLPCDLSTPGQLEQPVIEHEVDLNTQRNAHDKVHLNKLDDELFVDDPIQLILWYHGDNISGSPFYSIDARHIDRNMKHQQTIDVDNNQRIHGSDDSTASASNDSKWKHFVANNFTGRAKFAVQRQIVRQRVRTGSSEHDESVHSSAKSSSSLSSSSDSDPIVVSHHKAALLTLNSVNEHDSGTFWCRVDYRWTRTTISSVRLNVLASPKRISIFTVEKQSSKQIEDDGNDGYGVRAGNSGGDNQISNQQANNNYRTQQLQYRVSSHNSSEQNQWNITDIFHITSSQNESLIVLDEGVDQWIACEAFGGNPTPNLSLYRNNRKLNSNRAQLVAVTESQTIHRECNFSRVRYYQEEYSIRNRSIKTQTSPSINTVALLTSWPLSNISSGDIHKQKHSQTFECLQKGSRNVGTGVRERSTISFLQIKSPNRDDIGSYVRCQANSNVDSLKPINRLVKIDVNLRPNKVMITGISVGQFVTAGNPIFVSCIASGVRPSTATKIVWSLDNKLLVPFKETNYNINGTTISELRLVPRASDNGKQLLCAVYNVNLKSTPTAIREWSKATSQFANSTHETDSTHNTALNATLSQSLLELTQWNSTDSLFDRRTLSVQYLPNITIEVLRDDDPAQNNKSNKHSKHHHNDDAVHDSTKNHPIVTTHIVANQFHIVEQKSVQIQCIVDSNPPVYRIRWLHDKREILPGNHKGIKLTDKNATLHVESVRNFNEGRYQCVAYNRVGRSDSREIFIHVLRRPRCASPRFSQLETSIDSPMNLFCQVEANPLENIAVYWETPRNVIFARDGTIVKQIRPYTGEENILDQLDTDYNDDTADHPGDHHHNPLADDPKYIAKFTISTKGPRSRMSIVAKSDSDFGLYRCWAENLIGSNRAEPCVFNLTSHHFASRNNQSNGNSLPPYQLLQSIQNCLTNGSSKELHVHCVYNANQSSINSANGSILFHLLLQRVLPDQRVEHFILANQTNTQEPKFVVKNLKREWIYQMTIFASNREIIGPQVKLLYKPPSQEDDDFQMFDSLSNNTFDDEIESKTHRDDAVEWAESKQSQSHRLGESQDLFSTTSHRFLVLLILCLSAVLILFSVLFAVSIVVCLRRTQYYKNQQQQRNGKQDNDSENDSKNDQQQQSSKSSSPETKDSGNVSGTISNGFITPSRQKAFVNGATLAEIMSSGRTPNDVPSSFGSVLIIESSTSPVKSVAHNGDDLCTTAPAQTTSIFTSGLLPTSGAFYRDLISVDSESSYANYTSSEASAFQDQDLIAMQTFQTKIPTFELAPKFLCQPTTVTPNDHVSLMSNPEGFISSDGNFQLLTAAQRSKPDASTNNPEFATLEFPGVDGAINFTPYISLATQHNDIAVTNYASFNSQTDAGVCSSTANSNTTTMTSNVQTRIE